MAAKGKVVKTSPSTAVSGVAAARQGILKQTTRGENPLARPLWNYISKQYPGTSFLGIWGDKAHQQRKSDHNSGNALDIGFKTPDQGKAILQDVLAQPGIKYAIYGRDVYYPNGKISYGGTPYDHSTHVHVSFNGDPNADPNQIGAQGPKTGTPYGGSSIGGMNMPRIPLSALQGTMLHDMMTQQATQLGLNPSKLFLMNGRIYEGA